MNRCPPPTETFADRIAWARAWRIRNRPWFDAIYGPPTPRAAYPVAVTTEPRRWRAANKAYFDALYGLGINR